MRSTTKKVIMILIALTVNVFAFAQNDTIRFDISHSERRTGTNIIPADAGKPNIRYISKYVAIPQGAEYGISIDTQDETTARDTYIEPASQLASDYDTFEYQAFEDTNIYSKDEFYPRDIVTHERMTVRGCDLILIGVATEQYNPVRKETKFYDRIRVTVSVKGKKEKNISIGERWNEILRGIVVNPEFFDDEQPTDLRDGRLGCNYMIVIPDNEGFMESAEMLRNFREEQGIMTQIVSLQDIGSNDPDSLKAFFKKVTYEWTPAPDAVLLLGDYVAETLTEGITSYSKYDHPQGSDFEPYLTDNQIVDFYSSTIPSMTIARMPAANAEEAKLMIEKTIDYELHPSTNESYYNNPVTAMGYQKDRWFQLCSEIIAGYLDMHGKQCVRINAIHEGTPDSVWSTAKNTDLVLRQFGPEGLDYIPGTMSHLTQWDGNDAQITETLRNGCFMLTHRDHGTFETWGEPYYSTSCINSLNNTELTFVVSANCQTGHFGYDNNGRDCFAERLLRVQNGAVAAIAASQLSYSFVNDTYVWGLFDYLYPDFMPDYGAQYFDFKYPAFANSYGKLFLRRSSFPYNTSYVGITNKLFHYFGDAYLQLNTEMPKQLSVSHVESILPGQMSLTVYAEIGTHVAISADSQLIAKGKTSGGGVILRFNPLEEGTVIKVVATKQNHYRHESYITVTASASADEYSAMPFSIFPNPCDGKITISGCGIQNIKIFNILGCKVEEINCFSSDQVEVDVSNLNGGIYLLKINDCHALKIHKTK